MEITVLKLGGSILCGPEDLERIADVVESEIKAGRLPVCVVSAMKGVTDKVMPPWTPVTSDPLSVTSDRKSAKELHVTSIPSRRRAVSLA